MTNPTGIFEQLDFIYMPSRDVAADVRYFTEVLGAQLTFAVEGMGTRVAMVELDRPAAAPPPGRAPRRRSAGDGLSRRGYREAIDQLEASGWQRGHRLEIPHGPVCSFTTPGGQRLAIYQLTRPEAGEHFVGRRDF